MQRKRDAASWSLLYRDWPTTATHPGQGVHSCGAVAHVSTNPLPGSLVLGRIEGCGRRSRFRRQEIKLQPFRFQSRRTPSARKNPIGAPSTLCRRELKCVRLPISFSLWRLYLQPIIDLDLTYLTFPDSGEVGW